MTRILGSGVAYPRHHLSTAAGQAALAQLWPALRAVSLEPVSRRLVLPIADVLRPRDLGEDMRLYRREATGLGERAARRALRAAGVSAGEVDCLIAVSGTGYLVPGLDVLLSSELGLHPTVARVTMGEQGCSGGGAALALAHRLCSGGQARVALVVCVELCSVAFRSGDLSADNLTSALVFADGAAASVLADRDGGLQIVKAGSRLVPDTEWALGFILRADGFHPVLDRRLPGLIERALPAALEEFGCGPGDFQAVHAGGPRIFDAVERALRLPPGALKVSREVFRRHGNLSSASLLAVLAALEPPPGEGLALAFGPGLSIELAQLRRLPG